MSGEPGVAYGDGPQLERIEISGEMIRLGQMLKLAGAAGSGTEAKMLLADGLVMVNGEREGRRGRQLAIGDVIVVADDEAFVVTSGKST